MDPLEIQHKFKFVIVYPKTVSGELQMLTSFRPKFPLIPEIYCPYLSCASIFGYLLLI